MLNTQSNLTYNDAKYLNKQKKKSIMIASRVVKRHFDISQKEIQGYILTSFLISIIIFFFVWRITDFSIGRGILHFIGIFLGSLISMATFIIIPKLIAIMKKYTATYTTWLNGLLSGLVIGFVSMGYLPIVFPGMIEVKTIDRLRHGIVFPGENKKEIFLILVSAPVFALFLGLIFKSLYVNTQAVFFYYGLLINTFIAIFSLLPFGSNLGIHLFYTNKSKYFIVLFFTIFFSIFLLANSVWAIIISLLGAVILYYIYKKFLSKFV